MGKGERRGGRAGRRAHHRHHHFQRRRGGGGFRGRGGGRRGITLNFSGSQGAGARYFSAGITLFMISLFLLFSGLPMAFIFGFQSNYYPLIMIGVGGALLVAAMFMCARAKRKSAAEAATNPAGQGTGTAGQVGPVPPQTTGTFLSAQPTAPDGMYPGGAIPGQPMPMSNLSYPRYYSIR